MAYPNPIIRYRENNREILRGVTKDHRVGRFVLQQRENETGLAVLDFTDVLNGATITAAVTDSNISGSVAVSSGQVTLTTTGLGMGYGDTDVTVTFSDGRVRIEKLRYVEVNGNWRSDYGWTYAS
jgi:hypothetical protein